MVSNVDATLAAMPDIIAVKSVRHRRMGPAHMVDAEVFVDAAANISAVEQVLAAARAAVQQGVPRGDVTLRALPANVGATRAALMAQQSLPQQQQPPPPPPPRTAVSDEARLQRQKKRIQARVRHIVDRSLLFACEQVLVRCLLFLFSCSLLCAHSHST